MYTETYTKHRKGTFQMSNKDFEIHNGVLRSYSGLGGEVTIPEGVTRIGIQTFRECTTLTKLTIPDSVTHIGLHCFAKCTNLTEVTIPDSVTYIGEGVFKDCIGLADKDGFVIVKGILFSYLGEEERVIIPQGVVRIDAFAFSKNPHIKSITIPDSVKIIGHHAFANCDNLSSVNIPDSVEVIEERAFKGCPSMADEEGFVIVRYTLCDYFGNHQTLTIPDGIVHIGNECFSMSRTLTKVTLPESVKTIGRWAFLHCNTLTSINIPDSVEHIGLQAFMGCKNLSSISIPDTTTIGEQALRYCEKLADKDGFVIFRGVLYDYFGYKTKITIPDSVTEICDECFDLCSELTEVTIPASVTKIGYEAFYACDDLLILAPKGSAAEEYADTNGIPFKAN